MTTKDKSEWAMIGAGCLGAALFVGAPFATIWALNKLFDVGIPNALDTWAAAGWLLCVVAYRYK